ncbi:MAG: hypothetical protein ABIX28_16840 [Vicinamibacterales bacterium]
MVNASPAARPHPTSRRIPGAAVFAVLIGLILTVPLGLRLINRRHPEQTLPATYLPSFEGPRERAAFNASRISDLARLNPGFVVIGDSMAGTRIDERRLGELTGRAVAPLLQAGSGSAFWSLALRNWVIDSGIHPKAVLIFFRDTNLTDVLFRLDEQFRWSVDTVAHEREPELDAVLAARLGGPAYTVTHAVDTLYQGDRARRWIEPAIVNWPARVVEPSRRRREALTTQINERFGLDHLRRMEAADLATADDPSADFDRYVDRSVLPLMLEDARRAGLRLCFVRVQRRPVGNVPPRQSAALVRYLTELRTYVEAHGGMLHDDTGDPAMTLDMYADGDHLAASARRRYTEILFERLRPLFQ